MFALASTVSVVLGAAACALWLAGHRQPVRWAWGGTLVSPWASASERAAIPNAVGKPGYEVGWQVRSVDGRLVVERYHIAERTRTMTFPPPRDAWGSKTWGVSWASSPFDGLTVYRLAVPWWAVALACAVLPSVGARRLLQRRREHARRRGHRCASCGYDLRATPARCPECGAGVTTS